MSDRLVNRHYQQAAAELAEAEGQNGMKGGVRIALAMVHALLFIGQKLDALIVEYRNVSESETRRIKLEREITGSGVIR